jgi:hypothetical protein
MKKPWEMTREEWQAEVERAKINFTGTGGDGRFGMGRATNARGMEGRTGIERLRFLRCGLPDEVIEGMQIPAGYDRVVAYGATLKTI